MFSVLNILKAQYHAFSACKVRNKFPKYKIIPYFFIRSDKKQ